MLVVLLQMAALAQDDVDELGDEVEAPAAVVTFSGDPVALARFRDLAWRRDGGDTAWSIRDGHGTPIPVTRLAEEGTNPLLRERLRLEEVGVRKKAGNERWAGIGVLAVSPIPLLALVALDRYRVREESFDGAARFNDVLIWGAAGTAALGATLVVDSFAWRPRLARRRSGDPAPYLPAFEADAMVMTHNERVRRELALPGETAER